MDDADDEPIKKRSKANTDGDGLEDSDEDEEDDDDDDDDDASVSSDKKKKKLRKMREVDELDEDDLALINEAKGITTTNTDGDGTTNRANDGMESNQRHYERKLSTVKAKSAQELSRGLFTGDTDSEDEDDNNGSKNKKRSKQKQQQLLQSSQPERYDEDGLDDFIEDDTGYGLDDGDDDDDYGRSGVGGVGRDKGLISQAQMNEAEEIFGTDYLDFMDGGGDGEDGDEGLDEDYDPTKRRRRKSKFKEAGVGVALGVDSDEEIEEDSTDSEDDDDDDDDDAELFGDDDMEDDMGYKQRAEVLKLKREKKRLAREERRRQKRERADAKRKAQLRRAFEPVQLVENFCTEKDDEIRMADCPERYYDWLEGKKKTLIRKVAEIGDEFDLEEEEEAMWIMRKISAFSSEIAVVANAAAAASSMGENSMLTDNNEEEDAMEKAERTILDSIIYALRYMRGEKLEPEFIKRYRMDIVASPAVRDNLYRIMDEDSEWERMTEARTKIEGVLQSFREEEVEKNTAVGGGPEVERAARLKEQFKVAEEKLNDTVEQERKVQEQLDELDKSKGKGGDDDDDDDDDDLFGDDDEEDDEAVSFHNGCFSFHFFKFLLLISLFLFNSLGKGRKRREKRSSQEPSQYSQYTS